MRKIVLAGMTALMLAGCAQPGQPGYAPAGNVGMNKTTGGALLGAAGGGLVGSQFGSGSGKGLATLLGVVLGGLAGGSIGASMDRQDEIAMARQTQSALEYAPSGQPVPWQNPDNGHSGQIIPQQAYQQNGTYCREYQQTVVIGGQARQAYGTACRQPDGTWKVVG